MVVVGAGATVVVVLLARRARGEPASRALWGLLAVAVAAYLVGTLLFTLA